MKTTRFTLAAFACLSSLTLLAQPASQTGGGGEPGVDSHPGYDTNNDGELSDAEKNAMKQEHAAMMKFREKVMLKKYDKDGDGKLSAAEEAEAEKGKAEAMEKHHAKKLAAWDTDKDGKLSDAEKTAMYKQKAADRRSILAKYDTNKDGMLDDAEIEAGAEAGDEAMDELVRGDGQPQRKGSNSPSSSE